MSKPETDRNYTERSVDNVNARPVTSNEVSYRNGYVDGRATENRKEYAQRARENNSAFGGLMLGILLTAAAGLVAGIFYFSNQQNELQEAPEPAVVEPQEPNQETTIIERTIERTRDVVPVPQPEAAPEPSNTAPESNVEINLPNPVNPNPPEAQPSAEQAPATPESNPAGEANLSLENPEGSADTPENTP